MHHVNVPSGDIAAAAGAATATAETTAAAGAKRRAHISNRDHFLGREKKKDNIT